MTLPVGSGAVGSNHLTISRTSGGEIAVTAQNMQNRDVGFVGKLDGSATFIIGTTDSGVGTEYKVIGNNASLEMNDASQNTSFWGSGWDVDITDNDNDANIQWNVNNGSLSALNTSRFTTLEATEYANNNIFQFGWGDAVIIDSGDYNMTQLGSGTSLYKSTESSKGAIVLGGAGNAEYDIYGNYGVFKQGTGYANYQINGGYNDSIAREATGENYFGHKNAILSNSQANIIDNGIESLIAAYGEGSTVTFNGEYSLGILDGDITVRYGENAWENYAFEHGVDRFTENVGGSDITFNLNQLLYQRGWTNKHGTYSNGNWNLLSNNWYMSNASSSHANNITGTTASTLLAKILAKGDAYWHSEHPDVSISEYNTWYESQI